MRHKTKNTGKLLKHAFTTQLIDLARLSDEELLRHRTIAGFDLVFKHIAQRNIDKDLILAKITANIGNLDHFTIQTILKYLANFSDMEDKQFCDKTISMQPILEGDVMTVAQQWEQKGSQHEKYEIAKNMLREGADATFVVKTTGLTLEIVAKLSKEVNPPY